MNTKNSKLYFSLLHFFCRNLIGVETHLEGKEILEKHHPSVLIGNHQHNFDVLSVNQLFNGFLVVLGKFELGLIPYFGQIYVLCGNVLVKRGNRKKALKSMKALEKKIVSKGLSVLVFPEGHRNSKEELLPFKKGAYYTAVRTGVPLVPFSVSQFMLKQDLNSFKKVDIYLKVHEPILTEGKSDKDIPELIKESRAVIENGIKELNQKYQ